MSWASINVANQILSSHHYLGKVKHGLAWVDDRGVIVFQNPRSRRLPQDWFELTRWCLTSKIPNSGSQQFSSVHKALKIIKPNLTTLISYSDPSQGHTGALYRACNWLWCPTWHRLRPPPSGNGQWSNNKTQHVKDRWVFPIKPDHRRIPTLTLKDPSILKKYPNLTYSEPKGVPFQLLHQVNVP